MPSKKQKFGTFGEKYVAKHCHCPRCKKEKTLKVLPTNFKCADLICDFCGYLAQVKSNNVKDISKVPKKVLGAAYGPQQERMKAGIYFPLFLVLVHDKNQAVYYLSADLQVPEMFVARKPLSATAIRAGWKGFNYDMTKVMDSIVRLI